MNVLRSIFAKRFLRTTGQGSALIGLALLISACATENRDKWLRTFFDGVPPATSPDSPAGQTADTPAAARVKTTRTPAAPAAAPRIIHEPYAERECDTCHESKFSQRLGGTQLEVCFTCHDDLLANKQVKHYPVEEGQCTDCHHPHHSPHKKLLVKTGAALCYDCHDDLTKGFKVVHEPVVEGDCLACHDSHASDNRFLLTNTGSAVCYECHDEEDVLETNDHQQIGETACTVCHNPHAGDAGLLLPNWEKRSQGQTGK